MTTDGRDTRLAGLCHLAGLGGLLLPLVNFLLPLLLFYLWRSRSPFVEQQGREAVNFQLTMVLLGGSSLPVLYFVADWVIDPLAALSLSLLVAASLVVYGGVHTVNGARHAFRGQAFHYPHSLRVF